MILAFSPDCPLFLKSNEAHLQRLLLTLMDGWHIMVAPRPEELRKVLPRHLWSIYGEYIRQSYKRAVNINSRWISHFDCASCRPADLTRFYSLRLVIVVENVATDGLFLRLIARKLRPRLQPFFEGPNPRIDLRQAGGIGEVAKEIARVSAIHQQARPDGTAPLQVLALVDSDARRAGEMSKAARAVEAAAQAAGAASHVLRKRTIENYIPDDALRIYGAQRADKRAAIATITSLTPPARDHYPMKRGLRVEELTDCAEVYPDSMVTGIGLGDFFIDLVDNFYHTLSGDALRSRDESQELDELLSLIEENL